MMLVAFMLFAMSFSAADLTLEEKVGQLLVAHVLEEAAGEEAEILVKDVGVGGIIYYAWANGLTSFEQVARLSGDLQALAKTNRLAIPLFIAADQEGGRVVRLKQGFTMFSSNRAVAETGSPAFAKSCAYTMGREMRAAGVNCNLAPVADINSNPQNPVIGDRSFGDSPEIVSRFAGAALEGYREAGVCSCLKHFPGHGDVMVDSHAALPVLHKSREELDACELFPFRELAQEADLVMTGHLLVPAIDPDNCATLSAKVLNILRKEIGFDGAIVSDSLVMQGVLATCRSVDEAAIRALNAGCDMLILGGRQLLDTGEKCPLTARDVQRIHRSIVQAVKDGRLSERRIDEAAERVLLLKSRKIQ